MSMNTNATNSKVPCRISRGHTATQSWISPLCWLLMICLFLSFQEHHAEAFSFSPMGFIYPDGCKGIGFAACPVLAVMQHQKQIVYRFYRPFPTVEAMYQDEHGLYHAFHPTYAESEPLAVEEIKRLEKEVGGADKLTYYVCVPEDNYEKFTFEPSNPETDGATCKILIIKIPDPNKVAEPDRGVLKRMESRQI